MTIPYGMSKEEWIRKRAYRLWESRKLRRLPEDPQKDWLDAEYEYKIITESSWSHYKPYKIGEEND